MGKDLTLVTSETDEQRLVDRVKHAAATDVGRRREENQDSYGILEVAGGKVYLVADGMGGVQGGALASDLAVKAITEALQEAGEITKAALEHAISKANQLIFRYGQEELEFEGMGTTLVGLAFTGEKLYVCNVGDSRAYRFRDGECQQLTSDHTVVQDLIRAGSLDPKQAESHPISHMLTRSLGPSDYVDIDCEVLAESPNEGDLYVLCSDGLHNLVSTEEIEASFDELPLEDAVQDLISLANLRGGTDNVTLIAVEVGVRVPSGKRSRRPSSLADAAAATASRSPSFKRSLEEIAGEAVAVGQDVPLLESHERTSTGIRPKRRGSLRVKLGRPGRSAGMSILFLALVMGFGIGAIVSDKLFELLSAAPPTRNRAPLTSSTSIPAPQALFASANNVASQQRKLANSRYETEPPGRGAAKSSNKEKPSSPLIKRDSLPQSSILSDAQSLQLQRRVKDLESLLEDVNGKLEALGKPLQGTLGSTLQEATHERRQLREELRRIDSELATVGTEQSLLRPKLEYFYETDPLSVARTLAKEEPAVKKALQSLENSVWERVKASDTSPKNINAAELTTVTKLVEDHLRQQVEEGEKKLASLYQERRSLTNRLRHLKREEEFTQSLLSQSVEARKEVKQKLLFERELAQAQLRQIATTLALSHHESDS